MIHQGQCLPLGFKTGNDTPGVHAQLDHLKGDAATDRFLLLGHVHHAAPALANLLQQFVMADPVAGLLERDVRGERGFIKKRARLLVRREERLHLRPKRRITRTFPIEQGGAFGGARQFRRRGEKFFGRLGHEAPDALGVKLD